MTNKKKIILMSICAVLVVVAGTVGGFFLSRFIRNADMIAITEGNKADVEWYDPNGTEFVISTAEELYELALLSDFYTFEGQTVKLGADIVINEGNAKDWENKRPTNSWYPIQSFAGTFDGQKHTISGLYGVGSDSNMGLFANTQPSCVIHDLFIKNSYFEMKGSEPVGGLASNGCGTFRKIYSDAIVKTNGFKAGGFIGEVDAAGTSAVLGSWTTFQDCWFDGDVTLTYKEGMYAGGFVGYTTLGTIVIEHCLNSGSVTSQLNHIGGFVGTTWSTDVTVNITDSLTTGKLTATWTNAMGTTVGRIARGSSVNFKDVFATAESYGTLYFKDGDGKVTGAVVQKTEKELTGEGGYRWTSLDFDNHWAIDPEGTPILQCFAEDIPSIEGLTKAFDISWYDETQKEFVITTPEEMYGLQLLSLTNTFKNKTIKLGNDIVLNQGKASKWGKDAPESSWGGISGSTGTFAGVFDGQGHSISGVYLKNGATRQGLFGWTTEDAVLKDFRLVNSYFEYTGEGNALLGGIAGRAGGVIGRVYCDAIMVSNGRYVGGIVGQDQGTLKVIECWYDGQIILTGENGWYAGGILGASQGSKKTDIEHCLNTADISTDMNHIGGIVGYAITPDYILNIKDCLNVGKLTTVYHKNAVGSIIGRMGNGAVVNIVKTCSAAESWDSAVFLNDKAILTGGAIRVEEAKLKGYGGYQWTELDFKNYWAVDLKSTPILKCFAKTVPSLAGQTRLVDTSWYSDKASTYTIDSLADLYGFAMLSQENTFAGKTIKLAADIAVNSGDASTWGSTPPANEWISIGKFGATKSFAGTFDGQGHTISGLYQKVDEMGAGLFQSCGETSVVKNLRLTNSYFEGTDEEYGIIGSISGRGDGRYENLYSDAYIVSTGSRVGGIVGQAIGKTHISNCWYDGSIKLTTEKGWYAGGIAGVTETPDTNTIEHCLFTGSIETEMNHIGGMVGYEMVKGTTLNIIDCLSVGTLTTTKHKNAVGSIIGRISDTSTLNISHTTGALETWECAIFRNEKATINGGAMRIATSQLKGHGGYDWTELDFDTYWVAQADATPVLKSFASSTLAHAGRERQVGTGWFDSTKSEYVLATKQELHGFALLSTDFTFEGKTVKLGANITVNNGDASTWGTTAPAYAWNSIGILGSTRSFNGTFDGQGYTIGGLYQVSDAYGVGLFQSCGDKSVVKNVTLTNSYFESTNKKTAIIGSIAGRGAGTYQNVVSDAIVVSAGAQSGGMIGQTGGDILLSKCTYDGLLQTNNHYAGGMVGHADHEITVKNSTFSGDLVSTGGMHNAGFVGYAKQAVKITGSKFSGTLSSGQDRAGGYIGTSMKQVDINGCDNSGTMTIEKGKYFGGYIGYNHGGIKITKSEFSGELICKGNYSGGFVGYSEALAEIAESRFAGSMKTNAFSGGFIGWQIGESGSSITHCLNVGTIETTDNQTGSFVGCVANVGFTIDDCLYAGTTPYDTGKWKHLFVGRVYGDDADVVLTNTFAKGTAGWIAAGLNTAVEALQDETLVCDEVYLKGIRAYIMTTLDFDDYWRVVDGAYPELKAFDGSVEMEIPSGTIRADYDWYNDSSLFDSILNKYTIADEADMLGFAIISQRDDFAGYTVKVGDENIIFNEGWTASEAAPTNIWMPIGNVAKPFAGTFDGNGKTITGLYVNASTDNAGMFSITSETSTIMNLRLENSYIAGSKNYVGAIAGTGNGTFSSLYSNAKVVAKSFAGGLIGSTGSANISEVTVEGTLEAISNSGGIIGECKGATTIANAQTDIDVNSKGFHVGGFVGYHYGTELKITDSVGKGDVTNNSTNDKFGGFVGASEAALSIEKSTYSGTVTNTVKDNTGGFVGYATNKVTLNQCNLTGTVNGKSITGGFVGQAKGTVGIYGCESTGKINAVSYAGGLIGFCTGTTTVQNTYIVDALTSTGFNVGGFVGNNTGSLSIENSRYRGVLKNSTTNTDNGGFVGKADGKVDIISCEFSGEISGGALVGGFIGRSTAGGSIKHSLFASTGKMTVSGNQKAGIVANISKQAFDIEDCLIVGKLNLTGGWAASVVANAGTQVTISNTYVSDTLKSLVTVCKESGGAFSDGTVILPDAYCKGENAYTKTGLDFTNYWRAVAGNYPELKAFDGNAAMTLPTDVTRADYGWYNNQVYVTNGNKYILSDAGELLGFAIVSQMNNFAEKTTVLGENDITLSANTEWLPIGTEKNPFAGTFNGNGKTISGVNITATGAFNGFFASTNGATIQNIKLNGAFQNAGSYCGGLIGWSKGNATISNVHMNVDVPSTGFGAGGFIGYHTGGTLTITQSTSAGDVSSNNAGNDLKIGGFVGSTDATGNVELQKCRQTGNVTGNTASTYSKSNQLGGFIGYAAGNTTLSECLLEGTVTGKNLVGGFIGDVNAASKTIKLEHCLFAENAKTVMTGNQRGGMIGRMQAGTLTINDCLILGDTGVVANKDWYSLIVGRVGGTTATITNTFVNETEVLTTAQRDKGTLTDSSVVITNASYLKGQNAYTKTSLDFNTYWNAVKDGYPELKAFAKNTAITTLPNNVIRADYSWYVRTNYQSGETTNTYTLADASDLMGFAIVSQKDNFKGETIQLGENDIALNGTTEWIPIGNAATPFAGVFNGNNKTISGLNINATTDNIGMFAQTATTSVIQNFTLSNSNIASSGKSLGSIVGYGDGKLENINSGANVTGTNVWVGGLVGCNSANSLTITKCEYSGTMSTSSNNVGGFVGISKKSLTITNSKFSGTLNSSAGIFNGGFVGCNDGILEITGSEYSGTITAKDNYAGGFVGHAGVGATITNCKNTGSMVLPTNKSYYGGFVGNGGAKITISNCQYAGSIEGGQIVGGFIGAVTKGADITHCLFASNGTMTKSGNQNGGFVGMASGGTLKVDDCLFVGSVPCFGDWGALILGRAAVKTVEITDTFVKGTEVQPTSKTQNVTISDQSKKYSNASDLQGLDVLTKISLDGAYWQAVSGDYPILKAFISQ